MNRGVVQSWPVQQMMAGNPTWWNINSMRPPSPQAPPNFLNTPSNFLNPYSSSSSLPFLSWHENQELPESWSQLLMGGLVGEEDKGNSMDQFIHSKNKLENWEDHHQMLISQQAPNNPSLVDVKQESSVNSYVYGHHGNNNNEELIQPLSKPSSWSPNSSVTSFSSSNNNNSMLDFSNNKNHNDDGRHPQPDRSSESNSSGGGGAFKKARVQPSTTQSTFKVRKEKLGDRITALHQLVSPFGKTDTASVLLEAIGYIRFLHGQIEALSLPYLSNGSGNSRNQHSVNGEKNCIFPEDPGQLLNENCLKRKTASEQDSQEDPKKDLRSRGLCLVPVSCTLQVGSDNGADYWAPALGGGFHRCHV